MNSSLIYWNQFPKATSVWYNFMGSMFLLVGASGLILNVVVILYLTW